jgi:hypothetical protein
VLLQLVSGLFVARPRRRTAHNLRPLGIEINDRAVLKPPTMPLKNNVSAKCQFVAATVEGIFRSNQDFPCDTTCTILIRRARMFS